MAARLCTGRSSSTCGSIALTPRARALVEGLRDAGVLTVDEFEAKKAELLKRI